MKNQRDAEAPVASFISANSKNGFFSLYDEVFDAKKFDKIFVISGGPGTGKSTLLRRVYDRAATWGCRAEQILCSSDPRSLDGVILEKHGRRVGLLDGTPPHGRIPAYPGVTEEVINLGVLWNGEKMQKSKDIIFTLTEKKKKAYERAYALLRALGSVREEELLHFLPFFEQGKAERQIRRKLQAERKNGAPKKRFLRAFSATGETILSFGESEVRNLLLIGGNEVAAEVYLHHFEKIARNEGIEHTVYLSPLSPDFPDALYLSDTQTLLIKERLSRQREKGRRIIAERFFPYADFNTRMLQRLKAETLSVAISRLEEASIIHRAMEAVYGEAMDFTHFDALAEDTVQRVYTALQ